MPRVHLLTTTILSLCLTMPLGISANAQSASPAETGQANAPDQKPAVEGQTRAPQPNTMPSLTKTVVAEGLPHLWSMEILPDGRMLVAAKEGAMHIVSDGKASPALEGVPKVASAGQGGLLDIALAPDFDTSKMIFFSFSEPRDGGNGTSVASAKLVESGGKAMLEDTKVVFRQTPTYDGDKHFGSRLVFGPNKELYVTVGERSDKEPRVQAQDVSSGLGKIFRIDTAGKAFDGNPFIGKDNALPEIWSYGHRNMQSATLDGQGRLWTVEHGPKGGDELNLPKAGLNYGWPVITYGIEYSGGAVGDGMTSKDGMEQPVYYWDPVIGPSGMAYYDSDAIPEWKDSIIIGGLVTKGIVVLKIENDKVVSEGRLPLEERIRDVKVGSDGSIYAVTEQRGGGDSQILKLTPGA
ncbi:PQQ-dependent sugar dehydrogenase [Agrobacterium rubi]|uniref:PQQ-dependent sugar dehydrogenase n=2 Tax=Agrobacterium rubi TaxID=28099 RepID=A0AAE7R7D8_9HYPH|nr:PQQ-dependent sugar dehydrogenase [Agrobacterium rubi]NTE88574.1 PQQ-dependent sugar dehydrogenase [Agrobacterium rubi]NTF04402.1 PQQ-dependent sugar dehydrogenase [Agrobacterium rubi]NTF09935.1 PQQ-dependent sugar dehydrogenase [Agrobacterium rubi]NTF21887.1 PQQ-dependent sugar dehydrogenase [Agrobacterium rubi]NTF28744.1 PQQ-dependent sugar dehydrogenase [Agrobacterium rubi]